MYFLASAPYGGGAPYIRCDEDHPSAWRQVTSLGPDLGWEEQLCQQCFLVITESLAFEGARHSSDEIKFYEGKFGSLIVSAKTCGVCRFMALQIRTMCNQNDRYHDENHRYRICPPRDHLRKTGLFALVVEPPDRTFKTSPHSISVVRFDLFQSRTDGKGQGAIFGYSYKENPTPTPPTGLLTISQAPEFYPASSEHIRLAKTWIEQCRKHGDCGIRDNLPLPKRVLDIFRLPVVYFTCMSLNRVRSGPTQL
jgi:hypothetical protein